MKFRKQKAINDSRIRRMLARGAPFTPPDFPGPVSFLKRGAGMTALRRVAPLSLIPLLGILAFLAFLALSPSDPAGAQGTSDNLIDVSNLAQLNAIRYDLDGNGHAGDPAYATAFGTPRCAAANTDASTCEGYELTTDLDFDTNGDGTVNASDSGGAYWDSGEGWTPIGGESDTGSDSTGAFNATFEGNGHTIANLFINRPSHTDGDQSALFGGLGLAGVVNRLGLTDVNVAGHEEVGGLVGDNGGRVFASYVTGRVSGSYGEIGGLVAENDGVIAASYSFANVSATPPSEQTASVGSLTGAMSDANASITASYATGGVSASGAGNANLGGLVGQIVNGSVTASYSTGAVSSSVTGTPRLGGLVGAAGSGATVTNSYWDTGTSGQASSVRGTGQTTSGLQTPTGYTGIYSAWNVNTDGVTGNDDPWDFGDNSSYPYLKVDFNRDNTATWQEFGGQSDYDSDNDGLLEVSNLAQLNAMRWDPDGDGAVTDYEQTQNLDEAGEYAAAFPNAPTGMGCAATCAGYELTTDLDFDENDDDDITSADSAY